MLEVVVNEGVKLCGSVAEGNRIVSQAVYGERVVNMKGDIEGNRVHE